MALTLDCPNIRLRDSAWSVANPYTNDGTLLAPTNLVPGAVLMYSVTYVGFNADGSLNPASMRFSLPTLTYTPPARDGSADGMYMVAVSQFDPRNPSVGSVPQSVLFFLDTKAAAAPNIALVSDSGSSANDGITNNAGIATSGVEAGAKVQYRVFKNGNLLNDWNGTYATPANGGGADGNYTVEVRQTDRAGNVSATKAISFTFDTTAPVALNAKLSVDNGVSTSDGITNNAALTAPTNAEAGARVEYAVSKDGSAFGAWSTTYVAPTVDGVYAVRVRQTDKAGNVSPISTVSYTLDTVVERTNAALLVDSGRSATDGITTNAEIGMPSNFEQGGTLLYSMQTNGGAFSAWSQTYTPPTVDGDYVLRVCQVDRAGNGSAAQHVNFTLDTTAPAAPNASLRLGSGVVAADGSINDATLTPASNAEIGSIVEYALQAGSGEFGAWATTYSAPTTQGTYTVKVRQTDLAGNVSPEQRINFTLDYSRDKTAPAKPIVKLQADSGAVGDRLTNFAELYVQAEAGAQVEYRVKSGAANFGAWADSYTAPTVDGSYTVEVRQTDKAGNVSESGSIDFTLDRTAPATPNARFEPGSQLFYTKTGALIAPTNLEPGAHLEYMFHSSGFVSIGWTSTYRFPTSADFALSPMYRADVRQVDAAGNASAMQQLFTIFETPGNIPLVPAFDASVGTDAGVISRVNTYGFTYDKTLQLTGKAASGTTVQIFDNASTLLGSTIAGADNAWTFTTDALHNDTHVFSAVLRNSAGQVTGNLGGPTITVTDPLVADHPWQAAHSGWGLLDALKGINLATGQHLADLQAPASNDALNMTGNGSFHVTQTYENVYDAWQYGYTGKGIVVAHIEGNVDLTVDYIAKGLSPYSWNFEKNSTDVHAVGAHGGLSINGMLAVAPDVTHMEIVPSNRVGIDDCIRYAVDHGARIVTMSAHANYMYPWTNDISPETLQYAKEHDLLIVASAGYGNYPHGDAYFAYSYDNVIAANYSGVSRDNTPLEPGGAVAGDIPFGLVAASGGTNSETAGTVGGFAALILQSNPNLTAVELSHILQQATVPVL